MKQVLRILAVLIFLIAGYYLVSFLIIQSKFAHDNMPNDLVFESEVWQKGTIRERGQMVNYLLDSVGMVGKSKNEIIKLTGTPDDSSMYEGEDRFYYRVDKGHAYIYDMIIFFDSTYLVKDILFDD